MTTIDNHTYEFTPTELTGSLVLEIRTRHRLSRAQFSELAGFAGRSTARLSNIENKESWKPGDREAVARVLNDLEGGKFDPRYHATRAAPTAETPTSIAATSVEVGDDADDPTEELVDVVTPTQPMVIELPISVVMEYTPHSDSTATVDAYAVSNGENQTFKRCRRKWWLSWYRGLQLRTEQLVGARAVGTRVHRALQLWYAPEGQPRVDPRDALERVIVEDWNQVAAVAAEQGYVEERFTDLARAFAQSTNLERAMVEGYVQWLAETGVDAELRVIAPETSLTADLEVDVDGVTRPVRAIGLLDVRVHRVTDNRNLFIDHKTVGDLSSPTVTLALDEQMLHYHLLEWLTSPDGDERCDGALYNMLRRVQRSARAKPPFYGRVEVHHNRLELESYRRRLLASTREIIRVVDALDRGVDHRDVAYPSPRAHCSWDCDFLPVCSMLDDGSPGVEDMLAVLYREHDPRDRYDRTETRLE